MKKKIFRIVSLVVALTMISVVGLTGAYAEVVSALDADYDAGSAKLTVSGKLPKTGKTYINIIIAPYGKAVGSVENISDDSVIVRTAQSKASGDVDTSVVMPDGELEAKYEYYVYIGKELIKGVFTTIGASDVADAVAPVNSATAESIGSVVSSELSDIITEGDNLDYISDYIYSVKPDGGYTAEGLVNAYMTGSGLAELDAGKISLEEFFGGYTNYIGDEYYDEYSALNNETKAALEEMFKKYPVEDSFEESYNKYTFVAKYKGSESAAELEALVLDYFRAADISLDEYNRIGNSVYQERVFDNLFSGRGSVDNLEDILDEFDDAVSVQADKADNASSGSSSGGGGGGGGKKGTTGSIGTGSAPVAPSAGSFADMANHWAKADVEAMYARGIVSGFPDGSFRPGQNVTRAEFAKMIAAALGLDTSIKAEFADVDANQWYAGSVGAAVKAGIVKGTSPSTFEPEKYITRQDAAVMLARVLEYKGKAFRTESKGFNDEASIAPYALDAVNGLANLGLINGYNGGFAPADNTTRAEAAALLLRVCDYVK